MASVTYTVEGRGEFPADMLRRDGAAPTDAASRMAMERVGIDLPLRRVTLTSAYRGAPLVARWNSFGWKVVDCSDENVGLTPRAAAPAPQVAAIRMLPPTWVGVLPLLLAVHRDGSEKGAVEAAAELRNMAALADLLNGAVEVIQGLLDAGTSTEMDGSMQDARALLAKLPKKEG
jgi:hypothetical protein